MKQLIGFLSGIILAVLIGFGAFWIIHDPSIKSQPMIAESSTSTESHQSDSETFSTEQVQSSAEADQTPEITQDEPESSNPSEVTQRAKDLAESYNSNVYTNAEIIVMVRGELSAEYGFSESDLITAENYLTDNGWAFNCWDQTEVEEQGAMIPLLTAKYYWRQTGRHGDQSQDDRIGRVGVALSHDGYTADQIDDLLNQLESEGLE